MAKKLTYKQYVRKITKQFYKIMGIWQKQHGGHGFFIRHIDGNRANNAIYNLAYLHASDVFAHINDGWVVDWECDLTPRQIEFVKEHADLYHHRSRTARIQPGRASKARRTPSKSMPRKYGSVTKNRWTHGAATHSAKLKSSPSRNGARAPSSSSTAASRSMKRARRSST